MKLNNLTILSILIIGTILVSGCAQEKTEEGFLRYERNSTFDDFLVSYKIDYPYDWVIKNDTDETQGIYTVFVPSHEKDLEDPPHGFIVFVSRPGAPKTLDELTDFLKEDPCDSDIEIENIIVGNLPARKMKCFKNMITPEKTKTFFILQVYTVKRIEILGIEGSINARAVYIAEFDTYSDYINEVEGMIKSFEII